MPCSLSALGRQNSSADLPVTLVTDTGLKGTEQDFKTGRFIREEGREEGRGRRERERDRNMYLLQGISSQFLNGGGNFISAPTKPRITLGCDVRALREISAMTELLDRIQPGLNLRRDAL